MHSYPPIVVLLLCAAISYGDRSISHSRSPQSAQGQANEDRSTHDVFNDPIFLDAEITGNRNDLKGLFPIRARQEKPKYKQVPDELKARLTDLDTSKTELRKTKADLLTLLKDKYKTAKIGDEPLKFTDFPQYIRILSGTEKSALSGDYLVVGEAASDIIYVINVKTGAGEAYRAGEVKYVGIGKDGKLYVGGGNQGNVAKVYILSSDAEKEKIDAKTDGRFKYKDGEASFDKAPLTKVYGPKPGVSLEDAGR